MKTGRSVVAGFLAGLLLAIAIAGGVVVWRSGPGPLTTTYHAVLLTNGQVYFGKVERIGTPWSPYTVLTEVYYVQVVQNPDTKQSTNVLIRRGKEWHAPDHMILNSNLIMMIEPVTEDSKVARLIAEEKAGQQP